MSADLLRGVQFRSRFGPSARGGWITGSELSAVLLREVGLGLVGVSRILLRVRVFHMSGILVLLRKGLGCLHLLASCAGRRPSFCLGYCTEGCLVSVMQARVLLRGEHILFVGGLAQMDFFTPRKLMQFGNIWMPRPGPPHGPGPLCGRPHPPAPRPTTRGARAWAHAWEAECIQARGLCFPRVNSL